MSTAESEVKKDLKQRIKEELKQQREPEFNSKSKLSKLLAKKDSEKKKTD